METTEKIVESYVRYIKNWFTIPNIKCNEQKEIDLLAIDMSSSRKIYRYHIETSVSVSQTFSKLTTKPFSKDKLKKRVAGQRRTLGFFAEQKFNDQNIIEKLKFYGFKNNNYSKVIVTWGWNDDVPKAAKKIDILIWDLKNILNKIAENTRLNNTYFTDDTMRTLQLMTRSLSGK